MNLRIIDNYTYEDKNFLDKSLDFISAPARLALGGRTISTKGTSESPRMLRIFLAFVCTFLFPIGILSLTALGIKKWTAYEWRWEKSKIKCWEKSKPEETQKYLAEQERVKAILLKRFKNNVARSPATLSQEGLDFQESAKEAIERILEAPSDKEDKFKRIRGGEHACIITHKLPNIIFKLNFTLECKEYTAYIEKNEKARKICEDHLLFLLYSPPCALLSFKKNFIIQERLKLLTEDYWAQKSIYRLMLNDLDLRPYAKELFIQFMIFTCKMRFSDFKYNNLFSTEEGDVALVDVDDHNAVEGLTEGRLIARKTSAKQGLFSMIPLEWFDEFIALIRDNKLLEEKDFQEFKKKLPTLRKRAKKREEREKNIKKFYQKQEIEYPTQQMSFEEKRFKEYSSKISFLCKTIIRHLNQDIPNSKLKSLISGRKSSIEYDPSSSFAGEVREFNEMKEFNEIWLFLYTTRALEALKREGYIYSYKINQTNKLFRIIY